MTENHKKDLTYEIIRDAVNGNDEAEEFILDYYEPYIIKLSKKAQAKAQAEAEAKAAAEAEAAQAAEAPAEA